MISIAPLLRSGGLYLGCADTAHGVWRPSYPSHGCPQVAVVCRARPTYFSRNLKQCKHEFFVFVSTNVYLYYEFASSCQACQSIFGVTYYTEDDYMADDLWHNTKNLRNGAKIRPLHDIDQDEVSNSINLSRHNNDFSVFGENTIALKNVSNEAVEKGQKIVFEDINETRGHESVEELDSFYGIWGRPETTKTVKKK